MEGRDEVCGGERGVPPRGAGGVRVGEDFYRRHDGRGCLERRWRASALVVKGVVSLAVSVAVLSGKLEQKTSGVAVYPERVLEAGRRDSAS